MVHTPPGNEFRWSIGPNVPFVRKKFHFTDEWHDLVTAIRKYSVFADGPALPFRDTGFWARNGVSLHGKASIFAKPARDTDFWTENGVSRHGETAQWAKTCSRLVNWAG